MCRIQRDFPAAERRHPRKVLCCVHMSTEVGPGGNGLKEAFVLNRECEDFKHSQLNTEPVLLHSGLLSFDIKIPPVVCISPEVSPCRIL